MAIAYCERCKRDTVHNRGTNEGAKKREGKTHRCAVCHKPKNA